MYLEKSEVQSRFTTLLSVVFLSIAVFIFYSFKGEAGNEDSYINLANLKSFSELGELRTYQEPLSFIVLLFFHKIFGMSYMKAYQFTLAFVLSSFLHLVLLAIREKTWKLNHYFLIYLVAFFPFTIYLPYYFLEEFLCFTFLFELQVGFQLEKIRDLFRLIGYTFLSFFSSVSTFLFGYLFFVAWNTNRKMQEKKTTVFFKKKNIPLRIFLVYFSFFCFMIFLFWLVDFYGKGTVKFMFKNFWDFLISLFPVLLSIYIGEYLLRSEKELNALGTTAVVSILILISAYYTFRSSYENITSFENYHLEILNLKKSSILQNKSRIIATGSIANYLYYKIGEPIVVEYSRANENDYVLVPQVTNDLLKNLTVPYQVLDKNTILIQKKDFENILKTKREDASFKHLNTIQQIYTRQLLPSEKFNRVLCYLFGLT